MNKWIIGIVVILLLAFLALYIAAKRQINLQNQTFRVKKKPDPITKTGTYVWLGNEYTFGPNSGLSHAPNEKGLALSWFADERIWEFQLINTTVNPAQAAVAAAGSFV